MSGITLQSNIRSNLIALQNTSDLLNASQGRLATGKKVNSALDNPLNFAVSQSLSDRSESLNSLLDGMSNGVQTIQAANKGADSIIANLKAAQGIIAQAKAAAAAQTTAASGTTTALTGGTSFTGESGDKLQITNTSDNSVTNIDISGATSVQGVIDAVNNGTGGNYSATIDGGKLKIAASSAKAGQSFTVAVSATNTQGAKNTTLFGATAGATSANTNAVSQSTLTSYANQLNDLMDSISQTASDSGYNGVNLLQAGSQMRVNFNKDGSSSETVKGQDLSLGGLNLAKIAAPASASLANITSLDTQLSTAIDTSRSFQSSLSTGLSIVQTRQDFSKSMSDILDTGAANLVNADTNKEAANVLALQTRQSLSQSALSLANQANQGVLQLLR